MGPRGKKKKTKISGLSNRLDKDIFSGNFFFFFLVMTLINSDTNRVSYNSVKC